MPSVESLIEHSPVLLAVVDESLACVAVSRAWGRRLNRNEDALPLPVGDLFVHDSAALVSMRLDDVLGEGQTLAGLPVALPSAGGPAHGLLSAWPIVADDGGSRALIAVLEADEINEAYEGLSRLGDGAQMAHDSVPQSENQRVPDLNRRLLAERDYLRRQDQRLAGSGVFVGSSPALERLRSQVEAVASASANVLLQGERGAGKEQIARAIHRRSVCAEGPFVRIDCAAQGAEPTASVLAEGNGSEGHEPDSARLDEIAIAAGGTLYLEEIGTLPPDVQQQLVSALKARDAATDDKGADAPNGLRVIASTSRDLGTETEAGRFSRELYYLLGVLSIDVPPLRERREDLVPLAEHFAATARADGADARIELSAAQAERLRSYDWPGNLDELRIVIERALMRSDDGGLILPTVIDDGSQAQAGAAEPTTAERGFMTHAELRDAEKHNLVAALQQARWKVWGPDGAAELLGMKPSTLTYRMKILGIEKPE